LKRAGIIPIVLSVISALFLAAPLLIIVPMSFSTASSFQFPPPGYGLDNFESYFGSREWLQATANSLIIATGVMALTMLIVIPTAYGYVRHHFRGKGWVNLLVMMPLIVPQMVSAIGYYGYLSRLGIGGTHFGVIIAHTALAIPVSFLVVTATLKGFDRNVERAAMMAGAGPLRTFFWVTLPILKPGILISALFAFLQSFNEAVVAIFIGGRNAETLPKKMFESIRLEADPVIAAVSTLLTGAVAVGVLLSVILRKKREYAA
jgi:putative spermidine/putrescine transport system permease protein